MSYVRLKSPPQGPAASLPHPNAQTQYPPLSHSNHSRTPLADPAARSSSAMQANQATPGKWMLYPSRSKPMSATRRRRLLLSYTPDWLITLVLAAAFYALEKIEGYRREFSLADTSLRHPYTVHERVPNLWLFIACFGIPFVLQPIINFFTVRSWWDLHNSWLGLVLGLALTGATTQFVKITVGRPRPDIIDRCQPRVLEDPPLKLSDWMICDRTDLLNDGFRSFPSGHSSMSFAGLGFLAFYLAGKLHLFDTRGHAGKAWISILPFFGASLIAISRSMDYRHHWQDITVGSILGTLLAYFAYRQYYPPLSSEVAHRPYSPRVQEATSEALLPTHAHAPVANSTAYNPHSYRFDNSPSPPNPFNPPNAQGYETVTLGVDGTVPRPGQGSMEEVWKEGADSGIQGTVPRSRSVTGHERDNSDGHHHRDLSTREQQLHFQQQNNSSSAAGGYSIPLRDTSHASNQGQGQQQQQQYGQDTAYAGIR